MVTGVGTGRYAAFISYSHKDAAAARALHSRLERYRIPKRLVGTPGDHGPVPARLTPIFRDRDELAAAGDLSEKVRAGLAASDSLVVLCSPHSAASQWVAREIVAFRELNPGRPVLAAVVAGEPGACFPEGLGGADATGAAIEPLAADLRKAGDGQRLGFLKLVAGLTGVGLDALVQRDAARAIRRVTAVTLMAFAATLVMAVLTVIALTARQEADRQRAGAEGLVEFMLTDLRTKLKGVGRLDVMDAVNERAFTYYNNQGALGTLPDESLEQLARIFHARGENDVARGDMNAALLQFWNAHAVTAATLAHRPNDPKAIFAHGQSDYWIGRVHELRNEWPEAGRQYALYAESGKRLIAIDPHSADYMMERGWGALNLGIVALNGKKDFGAAERLFRQAVNWFGRALSVNPKNQSALREQANAFGWLADSFYIPKRWNESLDARRQELRIVEKLDLTDPANSDKTFLLATTERSIARLLMHLGDRAGSIVLLLQARGRLRALVSRDPKNAEWLLVKTMVECDLLNGSAEGSPQNFELTQSIRAGVSAMVSRRNPRVSEISKCVAQTASQ